MEPFIWKDREMNFSSLLYSSNILNEKSLLMEQLRDLVIHGHKPGNMKKMGLFFSLINASQRL